MRNTIPAVFALAWLAIGAVAPLTWADVESGPAVGEAVPALKVFSVTGSVQNKELDFTAERGDKPTVYVLIPADRWSRPVARLVRELDKHIAETATDAYLVAVWLTEDSAATKTYLPRAQSSLQLANTALTVHLGDRSGPEGWAVNSKADVTVVVAAGAKVKARFGFVSANETVADDVLAALKRAVE